ncbi:MAG: isoprenylcysteine carboxylmethyltransferase family protein [Flavisolibacter sp.]|nr:isoprenylcysteine carboxylmethyltransferase family protein [Flavisolibacter sp.]
MNLLFRVIRSIIYVPLFILAFGWLALRVRAFDVKMGITLPLWTRPVGIVFMLLSGMLVLACVVVFIIRGKGTPAAFDPPREFVATGPYAYVRNPMYIGGFILLVGFGLYQHSLSILILSAILIFLFHLFVVFYEEPTLERQFGKSYVDYKNHIHRWMPKWK